MFNFKGAKNLFCRVIKKGVSDIVPKKKIFYEQLLWFLCLSLAHQTGLLQICTQQVRRGVSYYAAAVKQSNLIWAWLQFKTVICNL